MNEFSTSFTRAVRIGVRHPFDTINPMAFFIIVTSMIALALDSVPAIAQDPLAIAILWIVVLLSTMMASGHAYAQDYEDGSLELTIAHQQPLYLVVLGSLAARWLLNTLPILALVPFGAWVLNLAPHAWLVVLSSLVAGSVVFTIFGILGATLTLGIARNGILLALLVLPLYVPVLLLGVGAGQRFAVNEPYAFALILICAIAVASLTFLPFAIAALLRISQEY